MTPRIRPARADEAELIRSLEASAGRRFLGSAHAYVADHPPPPAAHYAELASEGLVLLAETSEGAVGFAACERYGDALHLLELGVAYDHQGQGLGRRLVTAVAAEARRHGLPAVTLTTFRDLAWNAPWYARQGFVELGAGQLGERLRRELADEHDRGLASRCAMRLTLRPA